MLNVKGVPYRPLSAFFAEIITEGECIHTFLSSVLIVGQFLLKSCIESTMVPVAVYWGTPVKRRYLWSRGNFDTVNNAVQVGNLGKDIERNLEKIEICFRKITLFSYL